MTKFYTAEEAVDLLANTEDDENNGEMDSADSLDESSSSGAEETSESNIISDEDEFDNSYSGRKIMLNQMTIRQRGRPCKHARTRGGGARATTSCMRSIRTRDGSRAVLSQIPLPIVGDIDGGDKDMHESDESSNSNNAIGTTAAADTWKNENPTLQSFPFEENSGMNVNIPDGDDPIFYLRLLLTDELIKSILQCTNVYAQRVINTSRTLRRRSVLNEWRNDTEEEILRSS